MLFTFCEQTVDILNLDH